MAAKELLQCPNCRFFNRRRDTHCLMCKTALPSDGALQEFGRSDPSSQATAAGKRSPVAADEGSSRGDGAALHESQEGSPTARLQKLTAVPPKDVVGWLVCEPLPPIPLAPGAQLVVGRSKECDLVLPHKEVSRRHAVIKVTGKAVLYEDEGSSNGTFFKGKRIARTSLRPGDVLTLGPFEIELRSNDDMSKAAAAGDDTATNVHLTPVGAPSAAMTGKLEEVPLTEVLQGLEFNEKSGTLRIETRSRKGVLVVRKGRPVFAHLGELLDDEAVIAMCALRQGRFSLSGEAEAGAQRMTATITGLLLEVSRRHDEARESSRAEAHPDEPSLEETPPDESTAAD